ncbi:MAG TPA: glycosyltransferase family 2 protein [Chloroflexota bacterium]|nr:glycosyltransferase family 2 protein [Chloroflexota bacterium]
MSTVCAAVIARDAATIIERCLRSLQWADSLLVVVDDRTVDATAEVAASVGARVEHHRFEDYARQRNAALEMADADWVFFVDADEEGTPELAEEIRWITGLYEGAAPGYWVPRRNIILGRWIRHAGWSPDYQMRLLRRADAHYREDRIVHELVDLKGQAGYLRNPLTHYNYATLGEFLARQRRYAHMEAINRNRQGVRIKPQNYVLQPWRQFWRRFVTLEGYREGWLGFVLSVLLGYYELRTYLELRKLTSGGGGRP